MIEYSDVVANYGVHLSESLIHWSGASRGIFLVASAILLRNHGFHVDELGHAHFLPSRGIPAALGISSAQSAGMFLHEWTSQMMRSRLEPMKKIARNKVKLVMRKSYGFRT